MSCPKNKIDARARYGSYQHYCIDCSKAICRQAIRCRRCSKLGHTLSKISKEKISKHHEGKGNPNWKGEKITYKGIHTWVKRNFPELAECEICSSQTRKLEWANKDHKYSRKREDWLCLCRSCHMKYDYKKGMRIWERK